MINIIVAHSMNRVIGMDNKLPWHLPGELQYFKQITSGHTVIMGRKTYESIGKPLPNRRNIVITRNKEYAAEGVEIVHSLEEALKLSESAQERFIIGGAQIYEEALNIADRLYVTLVYGHFEGDAHFPYYYDDYNWINQSDKKTEKGIMYRHKVFERTS